MARVVTQRSGPPYLLIVFVFLFVISTALAVIFHLDADKAGKAATRYEQECDLLATSEERAGQQVATMMDAAEKAQQAGRRQSVVSQLNSRVERLVQDITGEQKDYPFAAEQVRTARERKVIGHRGVLVEAENYYKALQSAEKRAASLEGKLSEGQQKFDEKVKAATAERKKLEGEIAAREQQLTTLRGQMKKDLDEYDKKLREAETQWTNDLDDARKKIASLEQTLTDQKLKAQEKDAQIEKLQDEIAILRGQRDPGTAAMPKVDGTIQKILPDEGLCYISLGEKDSVKAGLTFSVYPVSGIPKDGEGKGTVVVTNVHPNTSECRIVSRKEGDPIVAGDGIGNVVFDSTRAQTFVVEGEFNLYGKGQPSEAGAGEVKALIRQFGGKVVAQIGIETDFVVIGSEPARPPQPAEDAPPPDWAVYKERMKVWQRYMEVKEMSQRLRLPIMNTSRFLAFVGYKPEMKKKLMP